MAGPELLGPARHATTLKRPAPNVSQFRAGPLRHLPIERLPMSTPYRPCAGIPKTLDCQLAVTIAWCYAAGRPILWFLARWLPGCFR
jgi:hypothetical protein